MLSSHQTPAEMKESGSSSAMPSQGSRDNWPCKDAVARSRQLREQARKLYDDQEARDRFHTTFTLFPKLPIELQMYIFESSVPAPQMIQIQLISNTGTPNTPMASESFHTLDDETKWKFCGNAEVARLLPGLINVHRHEDSSPSGLFAACRLSRKVILMTHSASINFCGKVFRFDSTNDLVVLGSQQSGPTRSLPGYSNDLDYSSIFSEVKHLALDDSILDGVTMIEIAYLVHNFPALKSMMQLLGRYPSCEEIQQNGMGVRENVLNYQTVVSMTNPKYVVMTAGPLIRWVRGATRLAPRFKGPGKKRPALSVRWRRTREWEY